MIKKMEDAERDALFYTADLMAAAARTAPKGSGKDKVVTAVISGKEKDELSRIMREIAEKDAEEFIVRDAGNVDKSPAVVAIGVRSAPFGLNHCSMCGFQNCSEMVKHNANCAFNITDLGIAIGSAVSVAARHHIDNRVMYSAGKGIRLMRIFPKDVRVCYGIPLYTGAKSIYFDRAPGAVLI